MEPKSAYFQQLAHNVKDAHQGLQQIAAVLRYSPRSYPDEPLSSPQVAREMQDLLEGFTPNPKYQRPQSALKHKLQYTWNLYGPDLLHTYDIPGLPPDNLQIEGGLDAYAATSVA